MSTNTMLLIGGLVIVFLLNNAGPVLGWLKSLSSTPSESEIVQPAPTTPTVWPDPLEQLYRQAYDLPSDKRDKLLKAIDVIKSVVNENEA